MSDDLVEEVARALAAVGGLDPDEWDDDGYRRWEYWKPEAKAVIPLIVARERERAARIAEAEATNHIKAADDFENMPCRDRQDADDYGRMARSQLAQSGVAKRIASAIRSNTE